MNVSGYFAKHWRGELSLLIAFWINLVFVDVVLSAITPGTSRTHWPGASGKGFDAVYALAFAMGLSVAMTLNVWQIVGILRSAQRRADNWGAAAVFVVFAYWLVRTIGFLYAANYGTALLLVTQVAISLWFVYGQWIYGMYKQP